MNNSPKKEITDIIKKSLWEDNYKLFLFWSRAKWKFKKNSDYDIWIIWNKKIDFIKILELKSKLNELPFLIDIIDFNDVDENFKKVALKNIKLWN